MYKITIQDEGIYKITGSDLAQLGVDIASIDPNTIQIFNNGGRELPRDITQHRPDSLIENAIRVIDGGDGSFNSSDYILFYGRPTNYWEAENDSSIYFQHYINHYTDKNVYWLSWGNGKNGKRMENRETSTNPNLAADFDFLDRHFDEDEINNFFESGLDWFGRLMAGSKTISYSAYLPKANNIHNNAYFRIRFLGMTSGTHRFNFYFNGDFFASYSFGGDQLKTFEKLVTLNFSETGYNNLKIEYIGGSPESQVYVDWYEIQYRKKFIAEDNFLWFAQDEEGPQKYHISNFASNQIEVYDITDWSNVQLLTNTEIVSGSVTFVDEATGYPRRQYFALSSEAYRTPEAIESVSPAQLRTTISGADFIIITHDDFYDAVVPLKQQRETRDSLVTEMVNISDIYNEFSWGLFDPTAIRDFIKYAFEHWNPQPKYVLLCGDGDYDYKNIKADADKNWIPPYETTGLNETWNRTADDWYVTVSGNDSKPDLAIGRFPVQSVSEVQNVVEKIIDYENTPYFDQEHFVTVDDWRNVVTMVGDDELTSSSNNETIHTRDAENIIENYVPNSYEKEKIYLIEYPAERDPSTSGIMKPGATEALLNRLNKGTLVVNYIGHGAPPLWAHERVLKESRDFERIQNQNRLPLWVAASCDFGRYDDPLGQGFAEKLFAARGRGGVAFLSSARLAYASDNTSLNRHFYRQLFYNEKPTARLGVALLKAKIANASLINDQKYHLFGDPTMRLNAPEYQAKITSISPDKLIALTKIKVNGYIYGYDRDLSNFEGKALLKVYDSRKHKTYITAANSYIYYISPGKNIFRGTISVKNGHFQGEFIVPKDISYGGDLGKVSIYFADESLHGVGYRDSIEVGGTSSIVDNEGPIIKIGFQGQNFVEGNAISRNSILEVEIADSISGINIVGDIGHNITLTLDELESDKIILTDYFNYYENNFQAGTVVYDFTSHKLPAAFQDNLDNVVYGLPLGSHKITIKAWDNFNNSSIASADFVVVSEDELVIQDVFNYPNPFSSSTTFTFYVNQECEVKIKVYTTQGNLIQTLEGYLADPSVNQIYWDGKDRDGDEIANGVYLYKIIARMQGVDKVLKAEKVGKLVITR